MLRFVLIAGLALFCNVHYTQAAMSYKGETLRLVVGYRAGGSADIYARDFAPHFAAALPGRPSYRVENMPGAATRKAGFFVQTVAPQDGTVVAVIDVSDALNDHLAPARSSGPDYRTLNWIGSLKPNVRSCWILKAPGLATWGDVVRSTSPVLFGAPSARSGAYKDARVAERLAGGHIRPVLGYQGGTTAIGLAALRGEVSGGCSAADNMPTDLIDQRKAAVILTFSGLPHPMTKGVPYAFTEVAPEKAKLLAYLTATDDVHSPYVMGPGVPAPALKIVRQAFMKAARSPAVRAKLQRRGSYGPMDHAAIEAAIRAVYATDKALAKAALDILK